jgi:predicted transposase YdaD
MIEGRKEGRKEGRQAGRQAGKWKEEGRTNSYAHTVKHIHLPCTKAYLHLHLITFVDFT